MNGKNSVLAFFTHPFIFTLVPAQCHADDMQAKGFDPVYGARPVKRAVQRELETGLAKALLRGDIGEEDTVLVDAPGGEAAAGLSFTIKERTRAEPPPALPVELLA